MFLQRNTWPHPSLSIPFLLHLRQHRFSPRSLRAPLTVCSAHPLAPLRSIFYPEARLSSAQNPSMSPLIFRLQLKCLNVAHKIMGFYRLFQLLDLDFPPSVPTLHFFQLLVPNITFLSRPFYCCCPQLTHFHSCLPCPTPQVYVQSTHSLVILRMSLPPKSFLTPWSHQVPLPGAPTEPHISPMINNTCCLKLELPIHFLHSPIYQLSDFGQVT